MHNKTFKNSTYHDMQLNHVIKQATIAFTHVKYLCYLSWFLSQWLNISLNDGFKLNQSKDVHLYRLELAMALQGLGRTCYQKKVRKYLPRHPH